MASPKTLFFAAILVVFVSWVARGRNAPRDIVRATCVHASYPNLCLRTLSAYTGPAITTPRDLAHAAVKISLSHARSAAAKLASVKASAGGCEAAGEGGAGGLRGADRRLGRGAEPHAQCAEAPSAELRRRSCGGVPVGVEQCGDVGERGVDERGHVSRWLRRDRRRDQDGGEEEDHQGG
ncbi:PREDICTED: uncharacterized protein LOC104799610 isoform X1 [Tarenaya hassleriana]|uniref:uncharacterized protein LOC104799610 isoform X1 n=1 Tax=Tarenaya hassleriana TaxID=28532 RepID=UPI00053C75FE|nr:PREDICTED: uncharacterized protein LOC104799610 isoform X1 [Tarenaya hassleriana]